MRIWAHPRCGNLHVELTDDVKQRRQKSQEAIKQ